MGKCYVCGKDTKNSYSCFSADIVNVNRESAGNTTTTTTTYNNFKPESEFLCTEHSEGKESMYQYIYYLVLPVVIGPLLYLYFKIPFNFMTVGCLSVLVLFCIFYFFWEKQKLDKKIKSDFRSEGRKTSVRLAGFMTRKLPSSEAQKKKYFSIKEYEDLLMYNAR